MLPNREFITIDNNLRLVEQFLNELGVTRDGYLSLLSSKKLYDNWSTFKTNYKNNPLVADRLQRSTPVLGRARGFEKH